MGTESKPGHDELVLVSLAHLSMIAQAARGEYKPQPGEIERRQTWLMSYLRTGKGLVNEEDRMLAVIVDGALSQSEKLSSQPGDLAIPA